MCEGGSNAIKLGNKGYDQSVTCLADDPQNLGTRSSTLHNPGILSQQTIAHISNNIDARVKSNKI